MQLLVRSAVLHMQEVFRLHQPLDERPVLSSSGAEAEAPQIRSAGAHVGRNCCNQTCR